MRTRRSIKRVVQEEQVYSKPITASQTFWGATLMAALILGFLGMDAYKHGLTATHGMIIPGVFGGYLMILQGRIKANQELPVYTPDWLPGPNSIDAIPDEHLNNSPYPVAEYRPDRD